MGAILFVNPRSGGGSNCDALSEAAQGLGVEVYRLRPGEDLAMRAREADADVLGMAGGDGSLGVVAGVAIERDLPFVCVPTGTRNHFATDVGLPVDDPLDALAAFADGVERRVDVGLVGDDRVFLNNVSFGVYARLVHRRERHRRRGVPFARMRALVASLPDGRWTQRFVVDGAPVRASVLLVSNNEYAVDLLSLGRRARLDEGTLVLYAARGMRRLRWTERRASEIFVETRRRSVRVAVDGEPTRFPSPVTLRVAPGALRLLVPPVAAEDGAPGGLEGKDESTEERDAAGDAGKDVEQVVGA